MRLRVSFLALGMLFSMSTPTLAEDANADWNRGALPSGFASVETPCAIGNEQTIVEGKAEGIRCVDGPYQVGIVHTDGASFANGVFGAKPFERLHSGLKKDARGAISEEFTLLGFRAIRWEGASTFGLGAMAAVEVASDKVILVMVLPQTNEADADTMSSLLDRAIKSLEITQRSASQ